MSRPRDAGAARDVRFVLQGPGRETQGEAIARLFEVAEFRRALIGVGYANAAGVGRLAERLGALGRKATVLVAIRNDITTGQALAALLDLGVRLYTVDSGARGVVFHPKVYAVRGRREARVLVGSPNLTPPGLSSNIEASFSLRLDLAEPAERGLIDDIEGRLRAFIAGRPKNVRRVRSAATVRDLMRRGLVVDEAAIPVRNLLVPADDDARDPVPLIPLRPKRARPRIGAPVPSPASAGTRAAPWRVGTSYQRAWVSRPLSRRDLGLGGAGPAALTLGRGRLEPAIKPHDYFRHRVFAALTWRAIGREELASADVRLVVKGLIRGDHRLELSHRTASDGAARRRPATRLQWGAATPLIARTDLLGRTLVLYRDAVDAGRFLIEID